jgi:hypothetical protein
MTHNVLILCSTLGHLNHVKDIRSALKNAGNKGDVDILFWFMSPPKNIKSVFCKHYSFPHEDLSDHNSSYWLKNIAFISPRLSLYLKSLAKWLVLNLIAFPLFYLLLVSAFIKILGGSFRVGGCKLHWAILDVWFTQARLTNYLWSIGKNRIGNRLIPVLDGISFGVFRASIIESASKKFLDGKKPNLVILPEFNIGYLHNHISNWCDRNKVPLIAIPYSICGRQEWAKSLNLEYYFNKAFLFNWLLKKAFPDWIYESNGKTLLLPISWLITSNIYGQKPDIPWVSNSTQGRGIYYAADDEFTKLFYENQGVNTESWRIIGSSSYDRIATARSQLSFLRKGYAEKYGVCPQKKWILLALPPDQTEGINTIQGKAYIELMSQIIQDLKINTKSHCEILIKLHPRMDLNHVSWIEKLGGTICSETTDNVLALSDLFVASCSATIRWAVKFSIPVINYDVFRLNYSDYDGCANVTQVNDRKSFLLALQSYLDQQNSLEKFSFNHIENRMMSVDYELNSSEKLLSMIDDIQQYASNY